MNSEVRGNNPEAAADGEAQGRVTIWEQAYQQVLQQAQHEERVTARPEGRDRRRHPRFRLRQGSIAVQIECQMPVVDISASGISLYSTYAAHAGQRLNLVLEKTFLVEVRVVGCTPSGDGAPGTDWPYRFHCEFTHPAEGLKLVVMLNEVDNLVLDCPGE